VTDVFELHHRPARGATVRSRVGPLVLAAILVALAALSVVALVTQDLGSRDDPGSGDLMTAWFFVVAGAIGAVLVLVHTWYTWPDTGASQVVIRLDDAGPRLRKGHFRDDTWYAVPWASVLAVSYAPIPLPETADAGLRDLRLLRFVPDPEAVIPDGPPGGLDHVLRLPPRESVLTFVAAATWDDDLRELLRWVRAHRPDVRVDDSVPRS